VAGSAALLYRAVGPAVPAVLHFAMPCLSNAGNTCTSSSSSSNHKQLWLASSCYDQLCSSWDHAFLVLLCVMCILQGKKVLFMTNNSMKSRGGYLDKCLQVGLPAHVVSKRGISCARLPISAVYTAASKCASIITQCSQN
jgi:hypothetical protein